MRIQVYSDEINPNRYGDIEDRYARLIFPTAYRHKGNALGYGLKFWPDAKIYRWDWSGKRRMNALHRSAKRAVSALFPGRNGRWREHRFCRAPDSSARASDLFPQFLGFAAAAFPLDEPGFCAPGSLGFPPARPGSFSEGILLFPEFCLCDFL
jgi:hypothetical protein